MILRLLLVAVVFLPAARATDDLKNPFAFHMFENFGLTAEVFSRELYLLGQLREIRAALVDKRDALHDGRVAAAASGHRAVANAFRRVNATAEEFPTLSDLMGAVNGMVVLHNTYRYVAVPEIKNQ